jgi:FixJ family two-component response regulator
MSDPGPTVFIVDDDASVRKSLARLLRAAGYDTEAFGSAEEFLSRKQHEGGGCIILDVRMPGKSGMELQEELRKADASLPIIFITAHGSIPMGVQAMKKGAVDFLSKPFEEHDLLAAVRSAVEQSSKALADCAERADALAKVSRLTEREHEILRHVIAGTLNKQIAFRLQIAEQTVKLHRGRIMEKLGVHSIADLVRLAEKAGIEPASRDAN